MQDKSKLEKFGDATEALGKNMMGCGCLVVIIAVILFLLYVLWPS